MKPKTICTTAIDIAMTAGLLIQMAYLIIGQELHEWLGTGMFVLFIAHNALNIGWYKNLLRGKYTPFRIALTAVNLAMMGLCICATHQSAESSAPETTEAETGKILVVYFSHSGNTRTVAETIHTCVAGIFLRLKPSASILPIMTKCWK